MGQSSKVGPVFVGILFILLGLVGMSAAPVGWMTGQGGIYLRVLLLVSAGGIYPLVVGIGLVRVKSRARILAVAAGIVVGISGSIFAAIAGNILPDLIENAKLAMPIMTAAVVFSTVFLVLFPGAVAYYLTRSSAITAFQSLNPPEGPGDHPPLPLAIILFALGMSAFLFVAGAVVGIPFLFPGFALEGVSSMFLWLFLALLAVGILWRFSVLDSKGWWGALAIFIFLLVSWSVTLIIGGVDLWISFPDGARRWLGGVSNPLERGLLGQEFFMNAAMIGYLIYIRGRFLPSHHG